eukprot:3832125-Pleurochrysis_carterae.AAC.2
MQSPQPSIVTPAPSPAPIDHSPATDPTTTAQPSSVAQPLTDHHATKRLHIRTAVSTPMFYWSCT